MIDWNEFQQLVWTSLGRDISSHSNPGQHDAIGAPTSQSLYIVAGPGSGKTTAITLRVLKLIFVDDVEPSSILVTTFTRKAASELSSRILGWGDSLRRSLLQTSNSSDIRRRIRRLNINDTRIGTLDSVSEDLLTEYRPPGGGAPVVVEDFVVTSLMTTSGLFTNGRFRNTDLKGYITRVGELRADLGVAELSRALKSLRERMYQLQVDPAILRSATGSPGCVVALDAIASLDDELHNRLLYDFVKLETEFLARLRHVSLSPFLATLRFVLVDEFQDTNLLQEQIYLLLGQAAVSNGGSIAVVGDDDQSLYRFRGATVDLFDQFLTRAHASTGSQPALVYLSNNYRSTGEIVQFCNDFITLDRRFQSARNQGKPPIIPMRTGVVPRYPVLGMFRADVTTLARDLAEFIHSVVYGSGFVLPRAGGSSLRVQCSSEGGSAADLVFVASSPRESGSGGAPRLPLLLRQELASRSPSVRVFNPRGRELVDIEEVAILCGLVLECVDPGARVQRSISALPGVIVNTLTKWREVAREHIRRTSLLRTHRSLRDFVSHWAQRTPFGRRGTWDREVAVNDLVYKLVTWIPSLQQDVECVVFLEVITRAIEQESLIGKFRGQVVTDPTNQRLSDASVKDLLWQVFVPLASGGVDIDENLLETIPTDRLNIMSVHQSKGLEFPLVIVDIGSDFKRDHPAQSFKRYPRTAGPTCNWEDELRPVSQLGLDRRTGLDRAFDDLVRHYFVAFTRAQDILLLVGLNSVRTHYQTVSGPRVIPNMASGWDRDGRWHWGGGLPNLVHI